MFLFSTELQLWYNQNKRDLPWRHTCDPYYIWISEVILQQTRVQQGLAYYIKFTEHFPNIKTMADASEQDVLNLWQGLGYYSRARNMLKTAKFVVSNFDGNFPNNYLELMKLPGVGKYTAAAVASFAFNLPYAVVDGNVYRVLSRFFNSSQFIDTSAGQQFFQSLADELLDHKNPSLHNQAIMELGALVCTPMNPKCELCPLAQSCESQALKSWDVLPKKKGKVKVRMRTFNYFIYAKDDSILIQKRDDKDIWANMYEPILIEGDVIPDFLSEQVHFIKQVKHKLTHQNLLVNFFQVLNYEPLPFNDSAIMIGLEDLKNYPLPRVIEKFFQDELLLSIRS